MNIAVILAGGTGSRAGGPLPKQFQMVRGKRMLWWSVDAFRKFDPDIRIVLVVHPDFLDRWSEILESEEREERGVGPDFMKVKGGESRIESVKNALRELAGEEIDGEEATVFIHDAARPFVTPDLIQRGSAEVKEGRGAVPVVTLSDSIRMITPGGTKAVDRSHYVAVQTPQVFRLSDIRKAYDALVDTAGMTDDASVAENFGLEIVTYKGDTNNFKITNPEDFRR